MRKAYNSINMANTVSISDPRVQEATKGLTPRQAAFAIQRAAEPTISGTEAVRRAGYKGSDDTLGKVAFVCTRLPKIQQAIAKLTEILGTAKAVTVDSVRAELERLQRLAEDKGDVSSAIRSQELIGKTIGAFVERQQTEDLTESARLEQAEEDQARRIARVVLRQKSA